MRRWRRSSASTCLAAALLASPAAAGEQAPAALPPCVENVYAGFDSRLTAALVARIPAAPDPVTGFEVRKGRPLVARGRTLVGYDGRQIVTIPVTADVTGLSFDAEGELFVQTAGGVSRLGPKGLQPIALPVAGRLVNSGSDVFVELREQDGRTAIVARRLDGRALPIAAPAGPMRASSWSPVGLAAVVGPALMAWEAGSNTLTTLWTDAGFERARDAVLVGPRRVVVTTPHATLLVTDTSRLVLAGVGGRVRWVDGTLYLFDERASLVWSLAGLDRLGDGPADERRARALLKAVPAVKPESHVAFLEAARIVGCTRALEWLRERSAK